jgi:hypothetical protein
MTREERHRRATVDAVRLAMPDNDHDGAHLVDPFNRR